MEIGKSFYVFEVLESHEDKLLCWDNGRFYKGTRFIGWENRKFNKAFKANTEELVCIPLDKVKKVFKVNFEDV